MSVLLPEQTVTLVSESERLHKCCNGATIPLISVTGRLKQTAACSAAAAHAGMVRVTGCNTQQLKGDEGRGRIYLQVRN